MGGLEGSVERGEPVDSATKGEVVKSSGHLVSRADELAELESRFSKVRAQRKGDVVEVEAGLVGKCGC